MMVRPLLITCLGLLGASLGAPGEALSAERPGFAHLNSDLPADPRITYGELANGVRYAVMENDNPSGTASIRVRMAAGSLSEQPGEEGLVHFLEHMAFNGSENMPEGEMVRTLERLGLSFGADTNAHVSFDETVYKLNLPNTEPEVVETAFMLMRETASNLLLDPEAIERERGVILSEMRTRNTLGYRRTLAQWAFYAPDSRLVERVPIGTIESIESLRSEQFRDFYESHYHPERAFVVVVGDIPQADAIAHIERWFGDWETEAEPTPIVRFGDPATLSPGAVGQFNDPDVMLSVSLAVQHPFVERPDTRQRRYDVMVRSIGNAILSERFREISQEAGSPLLRGGASSGALIGAVETASVTVGGNEGDWRAVLAIAEQEVRRVLEHGFTQAELDRMMDRFRARYENRVEEADSVLTHTRFGGMTDAIVSSYDSDRVLVHPADALAWFEAVADQVTLEAVETAFRERWAGFEDPLVFISSPEEIENLESVVADALSQSRSVAVAPRTDEGATEFAYTDFGSPGRIVEDRALDDIGARLVRFENNVRVNILQTPFEEGRVYVHARVGDGGISLPEKDEGLRRLALNLISQGGLEAHQNLEMRRLMAGEDLTWRTFFEPAGSYIQIRGSAPSDNIATLLNVLTAYTVAPGLREEAGERYKDRIRAWFPTHDASARQVAARHIPRLIRSGDRRFGHDDLENFLVADHAVAEAWARAQLTEGAIEITVVGDVDPDTAIEEIARTFGAVNERPIDRADHAERRELSFPEGAQELVTYTHSGEADQALLRVYWPAPDGVDLQTQRKMRVLRSLFRTSIVEEIRERSGAAYSPGVGYDSEPDFPGFGYIFVTLDLTPDSLLQVLGQVEAVTAALQAGEISEDQFNRALTPILEDLDAGAQSNRYWDQVLADAQSEGRGVDAHRTRQAGYDAITRADIQALAAQVFDNDAAVRIAILPEDSPS